MNDVIIMLFEGYGLRDEDNKVSDIQQMPVTWHLFRRGSLELPERQDSGSRWLVFGGLHSLLNKVDQVIIPASGSVKFPMNYAAPSNRLLMP